MNEYTPEEFAERRDNTCYRCNYDMHDCPGCGEPLPHGVKVCGMCNSDYMYLDENYTPGWYS